MRAALLTLGTTAVVIGFSVLVLRGIAALAVGVSKYGWRYAAAWLIGGPLLAMTAASFIYGIYRYEKWMESEL